MTTPRRSPSPSKARPSSASVLLHRARSGRRRFSGLLGSGWWLGKLPSTSLIQLDHLAAERAQDAGRRGAGDAVARVDHDLHAAAPACSRRTMRSRYSAPGCSRCGCCPACRAGVVLVLPCARAGAWISLAVDRAAGQHHLEAVVVLRVVAAGDLDAAGAQACWRAKYSIGVVTAPMSTTSTPDATRPRTSAALRAGPLSRPSRPTATAFLAFGLRDRAERMPERLRHLFGQVWRERCRECRRP